MNYYTMADIERIGPAGCLKHLNEIQETKRRLEDELETALRRENDWQPVLTMVRELWLMWKESEYHPAVGSPERAVMLAYDRIALLYHVVPDTLTCEGCGRDTPVRLNGLCLACADRNRNE